MNNSDMGRVHAYLLRHRFIETKSGRRNVSREEREIATLLRDADFAMRRQFEEILDGQGLQLVAFTSFDVKGIASGATVFMLARKPDSAPPFWGTERLVSRMLQVRGINNDAEAKTWFTQLWFVLLDLLYTRKNRSPNAMQDWVDTTFTKEVFIDAVKDYLNDQVRKIDPGTLEVDQVYKTLTSLKTGAEAQVCNAFLELMLDAGLIEEVNKDAYRQSLLFAYEMKTNFDRQLAHLLPSLDQLAAATEILVERTEEETEAK
ncbi:hypothetical protein [Thiobacillus denitrificans]|jgi:hypothetical protein|uniref:hypothetical protein n=1 Tax=Thiobacillus denitrificans TaxID=36861 RepID=UPI0012F89453|nr:hypothetical protein [Thiobacillus denitrificans]